MKIDKIIHGLIVLVILAIDYYLIILNVKNYHCHPIYNSTNTFCSVSLEIIPNPIVYITLFTIIVGLCIINLYYIKKIYNYILDYLTYALSYYGDVE